MFGHRLRLARKKAGLSLRALAAQVSPAVSAQAVCKYESGRMMPSSAVLVGLGKTLGVSLDFLMGSRVECLHSIEFRKHSGTSARDRAKAEAIITEQIEAELVIEDILGIPPPEDLLDGLAIGYIQTMEQVDRIAHELRHRWDFGINPVLSMTGLLEKLGIRVILSCLSSRFEGLSCDFRDDSGRITASVVVVSVMSGSERKRFALAQELARRIIRSTGHSEIPVERAAHRFAGAFLVPADHLMQEAGARRSGVTYHELVRLKHLYGVPAAAMLVRLGQAGVLPQSVVRNSFRTFARSWRKEEPDPISHYEGFGAFEHPRRFETLVWQALGEQLISPVRAAQFLKRPLAYVEREIRGPSD